MIFTAGEMIKIKAMMETLNIREDGVLIEVAETVGRAFIRYRPDLAVSIVGADLKIRQVEVKQAELPLAPAKKEGAGNGS